MPLSLLELAWLDIWPGQAWLAILSCLVWICQIMVIACSVPVSIPFQFHFHPVSIHSISMPIPISASVPIPAPWSLRFLFPFPFPLLLPARSGFRSHGLAWPGLAWPGARARPSLRSCRAFQRGDFASKTLQVCCEFLILPRGGLAVLTVVAA
jgi:hypothetical protein